MARGAIGKEHPELDIIVQTAENREKRLLISDMDSTMITVECIDELADYAGIKEKIAAITERAMQGELDFAAALHERVALLAGLPVTAIADCLRDRVRPMPGAKTLVRTMAARGASTILVSGGFTRFAKPVAAQIGFAEFAANILGEADGYLTGRLDDDIVDSARKALLLQENIKKLGLTSDQCLAVGDGANDIPMIVTAGLGVAYHAKQKARDAADAAINYGDLTALLYAQGISKEYWITD